VPSESYYDANGNAPIEGTYVTVSIKSPRVGQADVRQYENLKQFMSEKIEAYPGESAFEYYGERGKITFRRLDDFTVIASTSVSEDGVFVSDIWLHLDSVGKIEHILSCEYYILRSAAFITPPLECMSWLPVGNSIAEMRLKGGNQERSYRLSRQIRGDIEGFIEPGANP
jgi:hypothetical protein